MVNLKTEVDEENFLVSDLLWDDKDFVDAWYNNPYGMKIIYKRLEKMFGEDIEGSFCLYNKELLSRDFLKAFKYGINSRWDEALVQAFDPACEAFTAGCYLKQQDLENIQNMLAMVYKNYGEKGLEILRSINFAQGIMDYSLLIDIKDNDDKYDLVSDGLASDSNLKILELKTNKATLEKRVTDVMENSVFLAISNENIKSALFFVNDLLYDEQGKMVDDSRILSLKFKIQFADSSLSKVLNLQDFWKAVKICQEIYLEYYEDRIPRKDKNKVHVKNVNN